VWTKLLGCDASAQALTAAEADVSCAVPRATASRWLLTASVGVLGTQRRASEGRTLTALALEDGTSWTRLEENSPCLVLIPARRRVVIPERWVSQPQATLDGKTENPAVRGHGYAHTLLGGAGGR
jgi:hypothetical protein